MKSLLLVIFFFVLSFTALAQTTIKWEAAVERSLSKIILEQEPEDEFTSIDVAFGPHFEENWGNISIKPFYQFTTIVTDLEMSHLFRNFNSHLLGIGLQTVLGPKQWRVKYFFKFDVCTEIGSGYKGAYFNYRFLPVPGKPTFSSDYSYYIYQKTEVIASISQGVLFRVFEDLHIKLGFGVEIRTANYTHVPFGGGAWEDINRTTNLIKLNFGINYSFSFKKNQDV